MENDFLHKEMAHRGGSLAGNASGERMGYKGAHSSQGLVTGRAGRILSTMKDLGAVLAQVRSRRSRMLEKGAPAPPRRVYTPIWGNPMADYGGTIAQSRLQGTPRKLHLDEAVVKLYKQIKDKFDQ